MKKRDDPFNKNSIKLPFYEPWISDDDKKSVMSSLNQTMLTLGPNLEKFESMFAKYTKTKYAIAVTNCTAALHLSLKALGIGLGDEVIIPDLTFVADANAIIAVNATPILADIGKNDFCISTKSIKENISKKTKAIMPVHIYGELCNIEEINDLAKSNNLFLIEDCAHAIGTFYKNKHVGNFGNTGCFSFYPTKNMTTAEGGMVITNSHKISEKIKQLRSHGMSKSLSKRYTSGYPWLFDIKEAGYNYRLDEIRSSLGISQLRRINKINHLRKNVAEYYNLHLKDIRGIFLPRMVKDRSHSYHLYTIRVTKEYGRTRNELYKILKQNGIQTTVYWTPIHKYTAYRKYIKNIKKIPNTIKIYDEILSLPLYPLINTNQQDLVIKCIKKHVKISR